MLFSKGTIRKIAVNYFDLGTRAAYYVVKDTAANTFNIYVQMEESRDYRYFKDQLWQARRNKLIDTDTAFNNIGKRIYIKEAK